MLDDGPRKKGKCQCKDVSRTMRETKVKEGRESQKSSTVEGEEGGVVL